MDRCQRSAVRSPGRNGTVLTGYSDQLSLLSFVLSRSYSPQLIFLFENHQPRTIYPLLSTTQASPQPSPTSPARIHSQKRPLPPTHLLITLHFRNHHPQPLHHLLTNLMTPRHIHTLQPNRPHSRYRRLRRCTVRATAHSMLLKIMRMRVI